jgi:hypothetical protein
MIHCMNPHMFEPGKSHFVGFLSKILRQTISSQKLINSNECLTKSQIAACHARKSAASSALKLPSQIKRHEVWLHFDFQGSPTWRLFHEFSNCVMQCFVDVYSWGTKTCWPNAVGMKFTTVRQALFHCRMPRGWGRRRVVDSPGIDVQGWWKGKLKGHFDAFWCILQPGFDAWCTCSRTYIST